MEEYNIDDLITVKNFSKMLGVSTSYLYHIFKNGELPLIDIDGVKFVNTKAQLSFIDKKTRKITKKINYLLYKINNQ